MTGGLSSRPERAIVVLAGLSWAWMVVEAMTARQLTCCAAHPSALRELGAWIAMIVAMMIPPLHEHIADVSARSYRARRLRAVTLFVLGYLAWWSALGVAFVAIRRFDLAHDPRVAPALCVFAAGWTLLPSREKWRRLCHRRIVLRPVGWQADCDALRQGLTAGGPCAMMCWPLMVACALTGHNLVVMVACTALTFVEKRMFSLRQKPLALGALLVGATTLAF